MNSLNRAVRLLGAGGARQLRRNAMAGLSNVNGLHPAACFASSSQAASESPAAAASNGESWDRVKDILSSLIKHKTRADGKNWRDAHENMPVYLKRLGIEESVQKLNVIHVAGTKGKGSTCAMVESMLRASGYSTGLFTSPHLCDVRERVRINGQMVSKAVFADAFWQCYNTLQAAATDEVGMPGYFRFLTLLGLRIFIAAQPDVVILEVGIGGRIDATNILRAPAVTGITSLGFDHMELLGHTLDLIAAEKAGIMRQGVPCFTVQQPADAMGSLEACAASVGAPLQLAPSLSNFQPAAAGQPISVGLAGEHQLLNASLAVALVRSWEQQAATKQQQQQQQELGGGAAGAERRLQQLQQGLLPQEYCQGLARAAWPGRSQVVPDPKFQQQGSSSSRLTFFLDGAHTPESMITCGTWFAQVASAAAANNQQQQQQVVRVLVFNCMKERDPAVLLPHLHSELQQHESAVHLALFVPPDSQYAFLPSSSTQQLVAEAHQDLSWQQQLRGVWQQCQEAAAASSEQQLAEGRGLLPPLPEVSGLGQQAVSAGSAVLPSVGTALDWLASAAAARPELQLQVLVTGSLYLVGDCLVGLQQQPQ